MDNFDEFLEYLYVTKQLDNNQKQDTNQEQNTKQDKPKIKAKNDKGRRK